MNREQYAWGLVRIALGFTFFWAFIDKLFGFGFATTPAKSWLAGASPTIGFLTHATKGPFASVFQGLAGQGWVDALFMAGLLLIGVALLAGIAMRLAAHSGMLLLALMYLAAIPPINNPILDEHIIYILILFAFTQMKVGYWMGLGKWWDSQSIVKKNHFLE
jgi:thiosulfate dehydrogenase [quinone] large subunit